MRESPKHAATCAAAVASSSSPIRSASTIRRPHPLQRRVNVRRMGRLYASLVPAWRVPSGQLRRIGNAAPVHPRDTASTRADKGPALQECSGPFSHYWRSRFGSRDLGGEGGCAHPPCPGQLPGNGDRRVPMSHHPCPLGSVGPAFKRLSVGADALCTGVRSGLWFPALAGGRGWNQRGR